MDSTIGADDMTPQEKNIPSIGGEKRKREMKTPYQLQILEQAYAAEAYPPESTRNELSERIGLSERQIQMWFCHRRLKDRKFVPNKRVKVEKESNAMGPASSSYSGSVQTGGISYEAAPVAQPQLSVMELKIIATVEAQIGGPLREDGPKLGVEFEPLPPGAFGAPIVITPQQKQPKQFYNSQLFNKNQALAIKTDLRAPHDYHVLYEHPSMRPETYEKLTKARLHDTSVTASTIDAHIGVHKVIVSEDPHLSSNKTRKKSNAARFQNDITLHEHHTRTDIDEQKIPYGKKEKRLRREMERLERERRKDEERMLHEKLREQERLLREQKRESERREKFLQKEIQRTEKMRQKEELRREKEEAKLKAAKERANARKIAKEDTELIEDERLELMTLAASSIGLSSIMTLDSNTLQRLDMFRDNLSAFPPKSLQFKRPFATQPWTGSEENIANFLMVWKFLITFTNIFGLRPFTMDEFLQSLHDYDSKLLGEIHVALLKCIIKDIEDVARTSSVPNMVNQVSVSNGGHQQIIDGAYTWGFNIHSWQNHLNLLTWPEILRQIALSAGFGPQLKKKTVDCSNFGDEKEGDNNDDIISKLRSGLAAENAVMQMHEKGCSLGRKSRHRMTPGTLKFAAYHVLSLEGSKGLTLSELAEKIQRYGLRDLTGKTPETSIGVALSRDTRLFERIAPSTYRVRSAFRKDPSDADNILSVARQKILAAQNGILDLELAEKEVDDANDVEIDEDSESYGDAGAEIDILSTDVNPTNNLDDSKELKNSGELPLEVSEKLEVDIKSTVQGVSNTNVEGPDIDEGNFGEPWVQALTMGEYSDISVEGRLNALVALTNVVIEGNSIRVILEERLEAAYALKKQMWADAKPGKRRSKDEHLSKDEPAFFMNSVNNDQNNTNNTKELSANPDSNQPQLYPYSTEKSHLNSKSYIAYKAEQLCEYRCLPLGQDRRHNRYWIFSISTSPNEAGSGRIFFESTDGFWRIIDTEEAFDALLAALDTRGIRESHLHYMLQIIEPTFREAVRRNNIKSTNSGNLDKKSIITENVSSELAKCSVSFNIESGTNDKERDGILKRYDIFVDSMWKECYNPAILSVKKYDKRCLELMQTCHFCYCCYLSEERHCSSCHRTFKSLYNLDEFFLEHASHCGGKQIMEPDRRADVPIKIELLKAQLCLLEAFIPAEALQPFWNDGYRNSWGMKLNASKSPEDILQLVTILESGVKKDFLSTNPETAKKQSDSSPLGAIFGKDGLISGTIPTPWVPTTAAAAALRILELDASISSGVHKKLESNKETETADLIKSSSKFNTVNGMIHDEPSLTPVQANYQCKARSVNPASGHTGNARVYRPRGGRPRGTGGRMTSTVPKFTTTQPNLGMCKSTPRTCTKRGRTHGRGIKRGQWGRCSLMPRQLSEGQFGNFRSSKFNFKQVSSENSPQSYVGNNRAAYVEDEENSFRSRSDENGMVLGDEFIEDTSNYAVNRMESLDDYSECGEDAYGYKIQNSGAPFRNQGMDDDMDVDDFVENVNVNVDDEDYSSEYSD